jgi:probable F420-dependent oxidoreductase
VQSRLEDRAGWLALAREAESAGCEALYVADHPGTTASPFVALAAAAAVTDRIRLGTCVVNVGRWHPADLAREVATLDVVSDGRALLGLGAGHTPDEWTSVGLAHPPPAARVARLIEVLDATVALLAGGPVTRDGAHVRLVDAELAHPRPVQQPVPVMVGGSGRRVLQLGAEQADVVGLSGLGRTLADGHSHAVDWAPDQIARSVEAVRRDAAQVGREPALEALVQHVEITDDAGAAAARLAAEIDGATADDLLAAPYVWIGTVDEVRAELERHRTDLGIDRYVVRAPVLPDVRRILGSDLAG